MPEEKKTRKPRTQDATSIIEKIKLLPLADLIQVAEATKQQINSEKQRLEEQLSLIKN
jgi:hypothetical protein